MLRKKIGPKWNDITEDRQKLHGEGFLSCTSHQILAGDQIKKNEIGRECCTYGERRGAYKVLLGKPERKRLLGRRRYGWEDNIKISMKEISLEHVDWIYLADC